MQRMMRICGNQAFSMRYWKSLCSHCIVNSYVTRTVSSASCISTYLKLQPVFPLRRLTKICCYTCSPLPISSCVPLPGDSFYNQKSRSDGFIQSSPDCSPNKSPHSSSISNGDREVRAGDENSKNNDEEEEEEQRQNEINRIKRILIASIAVITLLLLLPSDDGPPGVVTTTWSDFTNRLLPTGQISKIVVFPEREVAFIYMYANAKTFSGQKLDSIYRIQIPSIHRFEAEVRAAEAALNLPPELWTQIEYKRLEGITSFLTLAVFTAIAIGAYYLFKRVKISFNITEMLSSVTRSKINVIDPRSQKTSLRIKFKDVAGLHEAKVEISEFVDYINNPGKYTKLGAKLPKGALLTGPPGCGKTLLAKALAAESSAPFISMNGTEFVEMIGGLGASRIRNLFKEAKSRAPCIIYIDEIDAIGRKRSGQGIDGGIGSGSGEEEQTLNQLLVEMDGMDSAQGVIVLASTNRADILDKALLRPGRFDRHITIDLPTALERKEMFELYLKNIKLDHDPSYYSSRLSQMTPGFSGADIANIVNEAAIRAASTLKPVVTLAELDYSLQRVLAGAEKRSKTLVADEKEIVAFHESGHALVGWLLEHTDALLKVSIIPRTNAALGFAQYSLRDQKLFSKEELFDRMCMTLGGRAAENVKFGRTTTGAQDDLEKVTKSAYDQVKIYGMNEHVGPLSFAPLPGTEASSDFYKKPYSARLQYTIDQEASKLVADAYFRTEKLLRDNVDMLNKLARELLAKEVLSYEEVKKLIGPPKYGEKQVIELTENVLPQPDNTA
ncbi:hypothetical protein AB6A40_000508 [Gnathostoma spinigerum]|uniref:AAA+ ATPase domain-containing protein n=1 Tax=Gnathostoma spinigerum TaxID=75299 RepID=A0ABD6E294_9BILA